MLSRHHELRVLLRRAVFGKNIPPRSTALICLDVEAIAVAAQMSEVLHFRSMTNGPSASACILSQIRSAVPPPLVLQQKFVPHLRPVKKMRNILRRVHVACAEGFPYSQHLSFITQSRVITHHSSQSHFFTAVLGLVPHLHLLYHPTDLHTTYSMTLYCLYQYY